MKTHLTVSIDSEILKAFKIYCVKKGVKFSREVEMMLKDRVK